MKRACRFILVGDSVGMVVLGYPDTTQVTLAEMRHHVAAVARAKTRALVVGDLPYHTYETPRGGRGQCAHPDRGGRGGDEAGGRR